MPKALRGAGSGLKGFPDAISTAFPETQIQLCIVHMVRNSVKYVPWKDYKPVTADLKKIYQSVTEDEALVALDQFAERWDGQYPQISKTSRSLWLNLNTLFAYPRDIRRAIYTTNAIESLRLGSYQARHKTCDAAMVVVYVTGDCTVHEIAEHFEVHYSTVSRTIKQADGGIPDYEA